MCTIAVDGSKVDSHSSKAVDDFGAATDEVIPIHSKANTVRNN